MPKIFEDLSWLCSPPENFFEALSKCDDPDSVARFANFSLTESQFRHLLSRYDEVRNHSQSRKKLRVAIVSNSNMYFVKAALEGTALRYGFEMECIETEYNQVAQIAFAESDLLHNGELDFVLLALDFRAFPSISNESVVSEPAEAETIAFNYLISIVENLSKKSSAKVVVHNFVSPLTSCFSSYERKLPGTSSFILNRLNERLDELKISNTFVLDINSLASRIGLESWYDQRMYNLAKTPFSPIYAPHYAEWCCRLIAAVIGKSRRVLVLDLDNTCWGGVIGDDGVGGIILGNGDAVGEAHLELQRVALALRSRGVVLCVSSKNEDAIARAPFRQHPDMILRLEHFALFQANWSDKATNIKIMSETLELGLDSFVFVDDNPAERKRVRDELPNVAVPELSTDATTYAQTLLAGGYFEAVTLSDEDRQRAAYYEGNAKRIEMSQQLANLEDYLKSLEMTAIFAPFDDAGRSRIFQLISKSNQFNLTTRRYSEAEISAFQEDGAYLTRQIRLTDCFGDNGMICVIICQIKDETLEIDTWLMSCRVLGRNLEVAVLQHLVDMARLKGLKRLVGDYIPTERNSIVKDHYKNLGFSLIEESETHVKWELSLDAHQETDVPIEVVRAI